MNLNRKRMKTEPHVPFIAMADIAWQVVILFFVAAAFIISNSVKVDLPSMSQNPQDTSKAEPIMVIAGQDMLQVDGKRIQPESLVPTLKAMLKDRKKQEEKAVVIASRPDLTWQGQVDVMAAVNEAGGTPVLSEE